MHVRIDQPWKNCGVAEVSNRASLADRCVRGNYIPDSLSLDHDRRRPNSFGGDNPSGLKY
jgi:hypothetical protein